MQRWLLSATVCCLLAAGPLAAARSQEAQLVALKVEAPELDGIGDWINTKPLRLKDLRGQVVVLHFWTFGCINCIHNYPSYAGWDKDYAKKGLTVIGVHTPETRGEADIARLRRKIKAHRIAYPVAVDTDAKTWEAWGNLYWPSVYLIDKHGSVRYRWYGELNSKRTRGEAVLRKKIEELLAEKE